MTDREIQEKILEYLQKIYWLLWIFLILAAGAIEMWSAP